MEAPGLDFGGFGDVQVAPGWPQELQIPWRIVSKTTVLVFGRSNLNAKNFDFGMRAFAFPQKAWARLGGSGVPPWGPSMEFAGVPAPAWLNPAFLEVWGRRPYREGSARPVEGRRRRRTFCHWAPSWLQVHIFSQFVCIFFARCFEVAFFNVSRWFLNGFWKVWGGFWGCFGNGFHTIFKKK